MSDAGLLAGLTPAYDTRLSPDDELRFQAWRAGLPKDLQSTRDYDLRGAFAEGDQPTGNAHMTDAHKKPNHPTYSTGSHIRPPGSQPGEWVGEDSGPYTFNAGASNLRYQSPDDLLNYFQTVESNKRVDPATGRISYGAPNRVVLPKGTQ